MAAMASTLGRRDRITGRKAPHKRSEWSRDRQELHPVVVNPLVFILF